MSSIDFQDHYYPRHANMTGWICSRCGISHAPHVRECGCLPPTVTTTGTTIASAWSGPTLFACSHGRTSGICPHCLGQPVSGPAPSPEAVALAISALEHHEKYAGSNNDEDWHHPDCARSRNKGSLLCSCREELRDETRRALKALRGER